MTVHVDKSQVAEKIAELESRINQTTDEQRAMSAAASERLVELIYGDDMAAHQSEILALASDAVLHNETEELARLRDTMSADLMKVTARYVVTNENLVSPAGFHPDECVFVQPAIAIHTDSLDIPLPSVNGELKAYEVNPPS